MNPHPLVLAVDDEKGILKLFKMELEARDFRVLTAEGGAEALKLARDQRPDILLLDLMMPDMDGMEVMRRLKDEWSVPVLLVTGKDSPSDKLRGLELGADDYIVKPFSPDELAARIRAVLRRVQGERDPVVSVEDLRIDTFHRTASRAGEPLNLTRTEWELLEALVANAGKVMLAPELLTKVWGPEYRDDVEYLRVWVSRLRQKIEAQPGQPTLLKTIPGIGYMFDLPESPRAAS